MRRKSEALASVLVANPLATVAPGEPPPLITPAYFSAGDAIGGAALLIVPLGIIVGTFALGLSVFNREAPRIAEEL